MLQVMAIGIILRCVVSPSAPGNFFVVRRRAGAPDRLPFVETRSDDRWHSRLFLVIPVICLGDRIPGGQIILPCLGELSSRRARIRGLNRLPDRVTAKSACDCTDNGADHASHWPTHQQPNRGASGAASGCAHARGHGMRAWLMRC